MMQSRKVLSLVGLVLIVLLFTPLPAPAA